MSVAVWFWFFGIPKTTFRLPYSAQSPTSYTRKKFETQKDIDDEVDMLCQEIKEKSKRTIGQELYHLLPSFTNPDYITEHWMYDVIDDYTVCKAFNIPVSTSLDSANSIRLDQFKIIANEIVACEKHQAEKNG